MTLQQSLHILYLHCHAAMLAHLLPSHAEGFMSLSSGRGGTSTSGGGSQSGGAVGGGPGGVLGASGHVGGGPGGVVGAGGHWSQDGMVTGIW